MKKISNVFVGVQLAERQFGVRPIDKILLKTGKWTQSVVPNLLKQYPRLVAYQIRNFSQGSSEHIYLDNGSQEEVLWIVQNDDLILDVLKSSEYSGESDNTGIESIKAKIRGLIEVQLKMVESVRLESGIGAITMRDIL